MAFLDVAGFVLSAVRRQPQIPVLAQLRGALYTALPRYWPRAHLSYSCSDGRAGNPGSRATALDLRPLRAHSPSVSTLV